MSKILKSLVIGSSLIALSTAAAQNLGFENGTTSGWSSSTLTAVGPTTTQAGPNTWVINPYGSFMGRLQIQSGSFNQMTSALGLTSSSSTAITSLLQQQAQTGGGNPNPTTAGWVTRDVTLTAGQTFTLAWQYVSVDYVPFNDGSIATLTQSGTNDATVNNYNQQYALLGFTNPGTGDYSTGSYGATGWQVATFQVAVSGTYTLGFGVFNLGDTALSPMLYIDEVQGTTTLNGQPFGAVAPNNATAPSAPTTPPTPPAPTTVSSVGSGTTVDTSNLASNVTVNGGIIQIATNNVTLTNTFVTDTNGMTVDQNGNTVNFSGIISGGGGVTIANTGTGGGVTFSAINTYTGPTTVNSGASLTNTGTLASNVTNSGTFTNTGTAAGVTNNAGGTVTNSGAVTTVNNAGTFNNDAGGSAGTVTNSGTFANAGTTGTVANSGTFTNTGATSSITSNTGTFTNSGTTGSVNNTGTFTNNLNATTGNVTNNLGGTFTNLGTTGSVNNLGTYTNSGTGTTWTNGFNGDGNTAVLNNTGTLTNGTNYGTFNNNTGGTVGALTNVGTFNNTGTTGAFQNIGVLNNNVGGTIGELAYNNHWVTNAGTITSITYNGGTVNNTGTIGSINNTEAHGGFNNSGTVTGDVTTNSTFNNNQGGTVQGNYANSGTLNNEGTLTTVTNNGTFNNNSGGTVTGLTTNAGTLSNNGTIGAWINSNTITNNGTMGNGTNNANSTFTNDGTAGNVTNAGALTNNGTLGDITTSGSFDNTGTAGAVTLTGGNFSNTGTAASVDNTAGLTFTNAGTITGTLANAGDVTNTGSVGSVTNNGIFNNQVGGVVTGNSTINNGTMTNSGTIGGNLINNGIATFDGNSTSGRIQNSGTLNIDGASNTYSILNTSNGLLNFNGTGTIGNVTNAGMFNFNGTGTSSSINNIGTLNISGTGSTGNVVNTGTVNLNAAANIGSITNAGVWNITGAGNNVSAAGFTQTGSGNLLMQGSQMFNITGPANLGGTLTISNPPTAFGRYTMLSGLPITGQFDLLNLTPGLDPLGAYLAYTNNEVKLYVTPNSAATQRSIDVVRNDSAQMNSLFASRTNGILGNDCMTFGLNGGCLSVSVGNTRVGSGDLQSGAITVTKKVSDNVRVGLMLDKSFTSPSIGSIEARQNPVLGGLIGWNMNPSGHGLGVTVSGSTTSGVYTINRPLFDSAEAGTGVSKVDSWASQVRVTYSIPLTDAVTLTPYTGIRYTRLNVGGYTETGAVFPLTINPYEQRTTDLLGGVVVSNRLTDRLTASVSAGVIQNLSNSGGTISGSSEIHNLSQFSNALPSQRYTSGALGASLSYEIVPNQRIGISAGWQQKSLTNNSLGSIGLSYSIGF